MKSVFWYNQTYILKIKNKGEITMGLFGDLFDFNNDGKLDSFEKAAEFGAFMQMFDCEKNDELTAAGLDPQELSDMGCFERRKALEDAGLDPDDYDF